MRRSLRLVNLCLGVVVGLIAAALVRTWVAPAAPVPGSSVTKPAQEAEALAYTPTPRPPLAQFDVLLEKNPFKQPPPLAAGPSGAPPPPPPPLPTLVGTILVDSERRAILSDKGKANIYPIGQEVAGGVITEIREDRILFKRGDTMQEIVLKAAIESGAAPPAKTGAPAAVPALSPGPSQPPPVTPNVEGQPGSSPAPGGVPGGAERLRQRQERLQMREQRRALRQGAG